MPTPSHRLGPLAVVLLFGAFATIAYQRATRTAVEPHVPTARVPADQRADGPAETARRPAPRPVAPEASWTVHGQIIDAIRTFGVPGAVVVFGTNHGAAFRVTADKDGYFSVRLPKLSSKPDPLDPTAGAYWIEPQATSGYTTRYYVGRLGRAARMTRNQRYLMYGAVEENGADLVRGDRSRFEIAVFPEYDERMWKESETASRCEGCGFTPPPDQG